MSETRYSLPSGSELPRVVSALPGPRAAALCDVLADVECPALTARRARRAEQAGTPHDPIVWAAARGANVVDVDGNVYVDMTAGFGAALLGHGHPRVVTAVQEQAGRLLHALGDVYPSEPKIALEARLAGIAPWRGARVILGLSGSDAVEAALKTVVLATKRAGVLAFEGGYHGLAHGPLAACGYKAAFRAPFAGQLGAHVTFAPFPAGDTATVARAVDTAREALASGAIGAVLIEPVLGRGGVTVADPAGLRAILAAAQDAGALVIADEIYTGLRRTSPEHWLYSAAHWETPADVVCLGKALGATLPVSACLIRPEVAAAWGDPAGEAIHTSTFLGNPLACAAALASLDLLSEPSTVAALQSCADALWERALRPLAREPRAGVVGLGGVGLLAGVRVAGGLARALGIVRVMLERGYIVLPGGVAGDAITLTPPCTLTTEQLDHFAQTFGDVLRTTAP